MELEDPLDELQRSLEAGADHYGINSEDVADRLFVDLAMEGTGLCTAVEARCRFKLLAPVYEAITEELIDRKIDVLNYVTAASLGFDNAERRRHFTVSDDKHNRAPAALADWFKLESVGLDNGHGNLARSDSVGVVVPWTRPDPFDGVTTDDLSAVQEKIANGEWRRVRKPTSGPARRPLKCSAST